MWRTYKLNSMKPSGALNNDVPGREVLGQPSPWATTMGFSERFKRCRMSQPVLPLRSFLNPHAQMVKNPKKNRISSYVTQVSSSEGDGVK